LICWPKPGTGATSPIATVGSTSPVARTEPLDVPSRPHPAERPVPGTVGGVRGAQTIVSDGLSLAGYLARHPYWASQGAGRCGRVICHGFPAELKGASTAGRTYPELADRLAADAGWTTLTFNFRGTGESEGNFSLAGWLTDLRASIDHLLGL